MEASAVERSTGSVGTVRAASGPRLLRLLLDHVLPALLWAFVAYRSLLGLQATLVVGSGWPVLLAQAANTVFLLLICTLFIFRRPVVGHGAPPIKAVVAIGGTFALSIIGLAPRTLESAALTAAGTALVILGLLWSVLALAVLGRCFGVFPEARGLVTRGPYCLVRHPLYFGEIVAGMGLALQALSPLAVLLWLVFAGLQLCRALNEERALTAVFPEYDSYQAKTRRLIPFLW